MKVADGVRAHARKFDHRANIAFPLLTLICARATTTRWRSAFAHPRTRRHSMRSKRGRRLLSPSCRADRCKNRNRRSAVQRRQPARLFRACAKHRMPKRPPCVVFFDGLDVTKEIQYMRGVPDLIKRGISVLVMDGPGTGEAIRFRGHVLRYDYEVAGSACLDLSGKTRGRRREKSRHRRHQSRRLLLAAVRSDGPALRRVHRMGRTMGLSRNVEKAHRRAVQDLAVGAGTPHHVDTRRRFSRCRVERRSNRSSSTA